MTAFFAYFTDHFGPILGWGILGLLLWRATIGYKVYQSGMSPLRKVLKAALFLVLAIAYLILPVDLIPDVVVILGQIDDLIILIGATVNAFYALNAMVWSSLPFGKRVGTFLLSLTVWVLLSWIANYCVDTYLTNPIS